MVKYNPLRDPVLQQAGKLCGFFVTCEGRKWKMLPRKILNRGLTISSPSYQGMASPDEWKAFNVVCELLRPTQKTGQEKRYA
jgi:hypothetical protein